MKNLMINIILNDRHLPTKIRNQVQGWPTHHSHTVLEVLANSIEQEKETKGIQIVEDKIKLFKGVMIAANMRLQQI